MRRFVLPLLLLSTLFAAPAGTGLDPERLARIPVQIKRLVDQQMVAGAVTLVARHGAIAELDAVGMQDIEGRKPMRTDSIFQIMSMTKPITAVGVMMLVEEGKLSLMDPVERLLPEFRGQMMIEGKGPDGSIRLKKPSRPITVHDLMTHTSGMAGGPPEGIKELNQRMHLPLAEAVAIYSQQPLEFEPGTRWSYSNTGIAVLGRLIEVVSDQPYERFLSERIFQPLGMKDTFFFAPQDKIDRIALIYTNKDGKLVRADGNTLLGGDSATFRKGARYPAPEWGLYSTAKDLFAFYQMMLNGGSYQGKRFLSKAGVDLMSRVHTGEWERSGWLGGTGYGLAFEVVKDPMGTLIYHSPGTYGHGGAYGTQGWIDPKQDLIRVLMIQTANGNNGNVVRNSFMSMAGAAVVDEAR